MTVAVLVVVAATALVVANAVRGPQQDGPLQAVNRARVGTSLAPGEALTWGVTLPFNPTDAEIELRGFETIAVRGVEVIDTRVAYPVHQPDGTCLSIGLHKGFPPPGIEMVPMNAIIVPPAGQRTCENHPAVAMGIRLLPESEGGTVDGLRVLYIHGGVLYQLVLPYTLEVTASDADTR